MIAAVALSAAAHVLVIRASVNAYGVPGSATIVIDRQSRRFARRFVAGPASEQEGFDGRRAWRADATGMSRTQANSGERTEIIEWSKALHDAVNTAAHTAHVAGATDRVTITFEKPRKFGTISFPSRIVARSEQNGVWSVQVQSVEAISRTPSSIFAPAGDAQKLLQLAGVTRIPVSMESGSPVLDVHVNGKLLHFLFDTGGQNVITTEAAKRIGLRVVGKGMVSGGGGGTALIGFATVDSLQIGNAVLRKQPFIALPANALPPVDGIVGYELLARVAARLDMQHGTLELAPSATAFGKPVAPIRFGYFDRQPQVEGSLDGIHGAFSIDTGSSLTAQVQSRIVRGKNLVKQMGATVAAYAYDVGGKYPIYLVRAKRMQLGSVGFPNPVVDLLTRENSSSNASIIANVGDGLLRRWIIVFDYPHNILELRPGGDPNASAIQDRSGLVLTVKGPQIVVAQVLSGTPASEAGVTEGSAIAQIDGSAVGASDMGRIHRLLRGSTGTTLRITFADGTTRNLVLRKYL